MSEKDQEFQGDEEIEPTLVTSDKERQTTGLVGRELDAAVANLVMGWRFLIIPSLNNAILMQPPEEAAKYSPEFIAASKPEYYCDRYFTVRLPRYSTDIAAAMEVVEKIVDRDLAVRMTRISKRSPWEVMILRHKRSVMEESDSLPEAICRAALATELDKGNEDQNLS